MNPKLLMKIAVGLRIAARFMTFFTIAVMLLCIISDQPIPNDTLISALLSSVAWFVSESNLEYIKKMFNLDDNGNTKED